MLLRIKVGDRAKAIRLDCYSAEGMGCYLHRDAKVAELKFKGKGLLYRLAYPDGKRFWWKDKSVQKTG